MTQPRGEARGRVPVHAASAAAARAVVPATKGSSRRSRAFLLNLLRRSYIPPSSPHKALARAAPFSNTAGLICAPRRRANFVGPRACRNAGMHGCDTPSGWPARWRSGCNRTVFAGSSRTTSAPIRRTRTGDGRGTRRWRPKWRASRNAVVTIGIDDRRVPEATRPSGGSLRHGPSRRMRPRR